MAGMTLLAADQLDWYVGKPWAMIIDVRSRREYEKGHVKGAVNLPYDHLDRKSTRLNSSHVKRYRMPSSA